jgi:type III secretion system FlhB-like substrate exporter
LHSLTGFLIEDDDLIAQRLGGKVLEQNIPSQLLNDTAAVVNDFFEYMIANTDWSTTGLHNSKVIQLANKKKVPLSYDFDMAGLVNAPYATINESLGIKNVQERLYRGYCRNESVMNYVRSEYLRQESAIMKVMNDHRSYFNENEFIQMKMFIEQFFTNLKIDKQFRDGILLSCRKN